MTSRPWWSPVYILCEFALRAFAIVWRERIYILMPFIAVLVLLALLSVLAIVAPIISPFLYPLL